MHPNPIFRKAEAQQALAFARHHAFGVLSVNGADAPLLAHVPFELRGDGSALRLHLVRSNPVARLLAAGARQAVVAVQGAHGYISPDWYGLDDQVPTWNYVAVHLRGTLRVLPEADLGDVIDRLSAQFEVRLAPKAPWTSDKMDPDALSRMMRQIVPMEMQIGGVDSTFKLSQNKPEGVPGRAADGVENSAIGMETAELAALMRAPPA